MHPALKNISYSGTLSLHSCPRYFELEKKMPKSQRTSNIHFAFGSALGDGQQVLLAGGTIEQAIWAAAKAWDVELLEIHLKAKKSFSHVVLALQLFQPICEQILQEWKVATLNGKSATELSFKLSLLGEFKYRGHVDVVLRNLVTGLLMVLELKTTGSVVHEAMYKNSGQAIGYSIILDAVATSLGDATLSNSFTILYLAYNSKSSEYTLLPFMKSKMQRATWIQSLMMDTKIIEMYEQAGHYPMYGESCYIFYSPCKYLGICEMSNTGLGIKAAPSQEEYEASNPEPAYTINLSLTDLINSQLSLT